MKLRLYHIVWLVRMTDDMRGVNGWLNDGVGEPAFKLWRWIFIFHEVDGPITTFLKRQHER
jgi:hypothetical protein